MSCPVSLYPVAQITNTLFVLSVPQGTLRLALAGGISTRWRVRQDEAVLGKQLDSWTGQTARRQDKAIATDSQTKSRICNKKVGRPKALLSSVEQNKVNHEWKSRREVLFSGQLIILSALVLFSCHTDRWLHPQRQIKKKRESAKRGGDGERVCVRDEKGRRRPLTGTFNFICAHYGETWLLSSCGRVYRDGASPVQNGLLIRTVAPHGNS